MPYIELDATEVRSTFGRKWIVSGVIEAFCVNMEALLREIGDLETKVCNSFFADKIGLSKPIVFTARDAYQQVRRWFKACRASGNKLKRIVLAINVSQLHWIGACVDFRRKTVEICDALWLQGCENGELPPLPEGCTHYKNEALNRAVADYERLLDVLGHEWTSQQERGFLEGPLDPNEWRLKITPIGDGGRSQLI